MRLLNWLGVALEEVRLRMLLRTHYDQQRLEALARAREAEARAEQERIRAHHELLSAKRRLQE